MLIQLCAVLYGIHPIFQRYSYTLRGFHMGCYLIALCMGFVADSLYHFRRHLQFPRDTLFPGIQNPSGNHQLYQIHLLFLGCLYLCQCFLHICRCHSHRACHMSSRHGNSLICRQNPRAFTFSLQYLIPQSGIKVPQSAHGTDGCHAAEKLFLCKTLYHTVRHRPGKRGCHQLLNQLFIVPLLFLGFSAARQMYVHINQSRHNILSAQIHLFTPGRNFLLRKNIHNFFSLRQNSQSFLHLHFFCSIQKLSIHICCFHCLFSFFLFIFFCFFYFAFPSLPFSIHT